MNMWGRPGVPQRYSKMCRRRVEVYFFGSDDEMNCKHFISMVVFFILFFIYIKGNRINVMRRNMKIEKNNR